MWVNRPAQRVELGRHPDSESATSDPFAFTSCQHYESGYFNGYPHGQKEDLDLVVHLGDYIYEYGGQNNRPRKHLERNRNTAGVPCPVLAIPTGQHAAGNPSAVSMDRDMGRP